jgi:PAS domain S-box-containing protein
MPGGSRKTKAQLLDEVQELRERIGKFEAMASQNKRSEEIPWSISASIPCVTYRCATDKSRTTFVISDYVEQLTGFPASDFTDAAVRTWEDIIRREDVENIDRLTKQATELGEPWVIEYRILCKDGSVRWVHERGMYVENEGGDSEFLEGVILDITERKQAENRLWESERKSRAWLEFSPACTKIVDLDFNLQYMSNAGVNGLQIDDITPYYGKPYPFDFYPEPFRRQMINNLKRVKETGEIATQEGSVVDTEGNDVWFHSTLVPVNDDEGRIDYIIVVSIDITERKRAEEQRISLERQVQHAQKLESLGVLSGGIAHDFNNILMSILGNADLALDSLSPHAPARANVQEIEKASKRAADLAKQMLAYSGKGRFVIEQINLDEFVNEMVHLLEVSISKKAVLKYNFAENLPPFDGDATQIRQVIMNLITNASEAIGDKSGVIALSTGTMECDRAYLDEFPHTGLDKSMPEGAYTYLEVADTGCGMDRETIEKIFDPFFTTKFSGRGLGMSAVLGIMRGHKGAIRVYSEPGKGTSFKVLFPVNELPDKGTPARRKSEFETEDWCGRGTVLIADDEEAVCAVGKQMLERLGFNVLTACDGGEAIEVFREHADEIVGVLLDLTMPHFDGEQTFREIHRIRPDIPVVLSSGYNMQDATQRFAGKGLAGFIQKPYNLATLREKLMEVLGGEGSGTRES